MKIETNDIDFGLKAKDKVTGFTGIITGFCAYMYGCNQYLLTPQVKEDNTKQDGYWVDEGRIEILGEGINPKDVKVEEDGCECNCHPGNF